MKRIIAYPYAKVDCDKLKLMIEKEIEEKIDLMNEEQNKESEDRMQNSEINIE
jgi:hypothetical protein